MKGVATVITTSALIVIAVVLLAIVLPWAWNVTTQIADTIMTQSVVRSYAITSDVYFIPPPAKNVEGKAQLALFFNAGSTPLTNVTVKMIDTSLHITDLNLIRMRRDGSYEAKTTVVSHFEPGDVIVAEVPADSNYLGYTFVFQSREYSEGFKVGD